MSYVFASIYFHFVWRTKDSLPLITSELEGELFKVIGAKCKELGCVVFALNGTEDHVHLVVSLPPTLAPSEFVKHVKGSSSRWVNHSHFKGETPFGWQEGYGVLTFHKSLLPRIVAYVRNQKEHHRSGRLDVTLERTEG